MIYRHLRSVGALPPLLFTFLPFSLLVHGSRASRSFNNRELVPGTTPRASLRVTFAPPVSPVLAELPAGNWRETCLKIINGYLASVSRRLFGDYGAPDIPWPWSDVATTSPARLRNFLVLCIITATVIHREWRILSCNNQSEYFSRRNPSGVRREF